MKVEDFRKLFPGLNQKVYGRDLIYLDNAATAQRSQEVLSLLSQLSGVDNANIHRSVYNLADKATRYYEDTRDYVKDYLNASDRKEIIFTSGTTFSLNMVAYSYGDIAIKEGDNIIVSEAEHHSNLLPWQLLCKRKGAELRKLPILDSGELDLKALDDLMDERTKLLCVAQVSNVIGIVNPMEEIISKAHSRGVKVLVDGAQGAVHLNVDVQKMDCDFYAFSGHKLFAATGTGVLYAKKDLLEQMPPFLSGGEMIGTVEFENSTYAELPYKFEAGTPNFNAIPTLSPALDLLKLSMEDKELSSNMEAIKEYVSEELGKDERIHFAGEGVENGRRIPLFSIMVDGVHHEDLAILMDKMGVALRSGHVCAEPLMGRLGVYGILRASFAPYNTMKEAEEFIGSLRRAIEILY
ncbi:MAG: aminotransferase class V-fold PLP-dependent enzyme [Candidatus Cryptobacteroides sp.]